MLEMKLFGTFDVRVNGAAPSTLRNRRAAELLALLALHHDRDVRAVWAAALVWPDTGSLDSLRQAIKVVRSALGPEACRLEVKNNTLRFHTAGADVDVAEFDTAIARGERGNRDSYGTAVALHKRPLLHGWDEGWVIAERRLRRQRHLDALQALARFAFDDRDYRAAAGYLTQLVAGRPTLESARCDLMKAQILAGERLEAIDVYNRYKEHLQRASSGKLAPPPEMKQMLDELYALEQSAAALKVPAVEPPPYDCTQETIGAPVPLESRCYIERAGDDTLRHAVSYGEGLIVICGPRQVGKSSLLIRGLDLARKAGARIIVTDLDKIAANHMGTIDEFLLALSQLIADQIDGPVSPTEMWHATRPATVNFERYVRREVLADPNTTTMWAICNVDKLLSCNYKDDVFGLFRAWYCDGAADRRSVWSRLKMIMDCSVDTRTLISDLNRSPFNVGTRILLEDFTLEQVRELCLRYGLPANDDVARLYRVVGGHPYLVRASLHGIRRQQADVESLEGEADLEEGIFGMHLQRLLRLLSQDPTLKQSMVHILQGRRSVHSDSFQQLKAAGLIVGAGPQTARPRCRLYETFFRQQLLAHATI
jgi:DNA-binding SARP family transcriptional activator